MESKSQQPDGVAAQEQTKETNDEDLVSAFGITAASDKGIDYDKLIAKFGCSPMNDELKQKIEVLTGKKPHRFIRRNIFFCHRDLDVILNKYEQNQLFYLYTGRGPSAEALHMGHAIPFIFNQYLQEAFDVPLVIQITDDEKFLYRPEYELEKVQKMAISNIKDIIAFGFNPEKTFIFMDTDYIKELYPNAIKVQKCITLNQMKGVFGFTDSDNVGKYAYPPIQAVPSFCNTFPHIFGTRKNVPSLIPAAIDQDPYFRMTRDIAGRLKYEKTSCFYSTFFPALQGKKSKMSSSDPNSSILLSDKPEDVKRKINKYAFSGGKTTTEEHKMWGADLDVDVPFQYLTFFLEDDDKLEEIRKKYGEEFNENGEKIPKTGDVMMTGEVKALLIECVNQFLKTFQERRKKVTDEDVRNFMDKTRKIDPVPQKFKDARKAKEEAEKLAKEMEEKAKMEAAEKKE